MKIKHQELVIDKENPFANCKLDRAQYAAVLTEVVNTYSEGFVLAINNEWGTGKTTFVKMWEQHLKNVGFQTIYFNAWENDFNSNPLIALMAELNVLTNAKSKKLFKSIIEKGAVLAKQVVPALAKSLVKKYIVDISDITADSVENTAKGVVEIIEKELKDYASKKKTIVEFRNDLEAFVKESGNGKPLVFIIDELDRCRPTYAVEVLEQMKHFFSVPGVVFALSIDKNHLASSVRGFYGSEQINTDEYLRRFIDLEYAIPKPSTNLFSKYLFEYFSFRDFFFSTQRNQHSVFRNDADSFLKMSDLLFGKTNITLRQQEKIFAQTRLILNSFKSNQYTFSHLLFVLVFIKTMKNELYQSITSSKISIQELSDAYSHLVYSGSQHFHELNPLFIQALLIHFYNNCREHPNKDTLFYKDNDGNTKSLFTSKLETEKGISFASCFSHISEQWDYRDTSLNYLLNKINLTESITA